MHWAYMDHMHRTTLVLDDSTRQAARQLASHYGCGVSEAIRRAVIAQRDVVTGVSPEFRQRRRKVLKRLIDLFDGSDPEAEVRRLKAEDAGF
jgi:hypothetical protein